MSREEIVTLSAERREEIRRSLVALLEQHPSQTARGMAHRVGATKSQVNSVLYSDRGSFGRSDEVPPLWKVTPAAPRARRSGRKATPSAESPKAEKGVDSTKRGAAPKVDRRRPAGMVSVREHASNPALGGELPPLRPWQTKALAAWRIAGGRGIIDAVTGAGKTRLAIEAIRGHLEEGGRVLVLVPSVVLLNQWWEVLTASLPGREIGLSGDGSDDDLVDHDVVVATLPTASRRRYTLRRGERGLIVADECHRAGAPTFREALDDRFRWRIGLSATHERMDDAHETVLLPYFRGVAFSLGFREAIADGVVANVRVGFVGIELSEEERLEYDEATVALSDIASKLAKRYGIRRELFAAFLEDVTRLAASGPREAGMLASAWLSLWTRRRELLAETPAKLEALACMERVIEDAERTLVFTQSIRSAEAIASLLRTTGITAEVHHSKVSSSDREKLLRRFSEGDLEVLVSIDTLGEGVDLPETDLAIIVAGTRQRRQMIQRMGRVMRLKPDGRDARFVVLYARGTAEDPIAGSDETFVSELVAISRAVGHFALPHGASELRAALRPSKNG